MFTLALILLPFFVFLLSYVHFRLLASRFWLNRKIPHLTPVFLLGNTWKTGFTENFSCLLQKWHLKYQKQKILGFWSFIKPGLLITDMDLTKKILIKDFDHFRDRGIEIDEEIDPLAGHLFLISGKRWRNLRVKLTPTFTSGKMKMMFPTMLKCGEELERCLPEGASKGETIDAADLSARFTIDVIASCAFGLESNSLRDPNSEFRKYGRKVFEEDILALVNNIIRFTCPILKRILRLRLFPKDVSDFFTNAVRDAIEYRQRTNTERKDFLQLLIQLLKAGKIEDTDKVSITDLDESEQVQKFSIQDAAAQCFVFFTAGFETSSVALAFALYELALNPDIQEKLLSEIDDIGSQTEITYDKLLGMEYLDKVVSDDKADLLHQNKGFGWKQAVARIWRETPPEQRIWQIWRETAGHLFVGSSFSYIHHSMLVNVDIHRISDIYETLRKYPPSGSLKRECTKDYYIREMDVTIEQGTPILISVRGFHYDPKIYPSPEKFDPERFSHEEKIKRDSFAFMPFGDGPRSCIGNRFALMQIKIGLFYILKEHTVNIAKTTPIPVKIQSKSFITTPVGGIPLLFNKR